MNRASFESAARESEAQAACLVMGHEGAERAVVYRWQCGDEEASRLAEEVRVARTPTVVGVAGRMPALPAGGLFQRATRWDSVSIGGRRGKHRSTGTSPITANLSGARSANQQLRGLGF